MTDSQFHVPCLKKKAIMGICEVQGEVRADNLR